VTNLQDLTKERLTVENVGGLTVLPVSERPEIINILVYGDPGVGKTVLAGSASVVERMAPVLVIDVEGGTLSLRNTYPDVDVVRVETWADMQKVYDALYDGTVPYKTVVLDSLTEIQKFSMYNIMHELLKTDPGRDPDVPGMREWGKNIEQCRRLIRAFRDLPINTIITALAKQDRDSRTGVTKTSPSLSGKMANEVAGFLDVATYMYTKIVPVPESQPEVKRLLLTQPTDAIVAKDRTGRLPQIVEEPTMAALCESIFNN